jgi:hypothetical protein
VHVKNFEACTGSRKGLQFQNKQKNLASAAEPAQTEGEQSISSFNVYGFLLGHARPILIAALVHM